MELNVGGRRDEGCERRSLCGEARARSAMDDVTRLLPRSVATVMEGEIDRQELPKRRRRLPEEGELRSIVLPMPSAAVTAPRQNLPAPRLHRATSILIEDESDDAGPAPLPLPPSSIQRRQPSIFGPDPVRRSTSLRRQASIDTISGILRGSLQGLSRGTSFCGRQISLSDEARFRRAYEDAVEDAGGGREVLLEVARRLNQDRRGPLADDDAGRSEPSPYTWSLHRRSTTQPSRTRRRFSSATVVTIGQPGYENDVEVAHDRRSGEPLVSRVHVVILALDDGLILCDVGSVAGFCVVERCTAVHDAEAERETAATTVRPLNDDVSKPGRRRPLLIGHDEVVTLVLEPTGYQMVISGKLASPTLAEDDVLAPVGATAAAFRSPSAPLSAEAHEERGVSDEKVCTICYARPKDHVLIGSAAAGQPCGHVFCGPCCEALPHPRRCPQCRANVEHSVRIFI